MSSERTPQNEALVDEQPEDHRVVQIRSILEAAENWDGANLRHAQVLTDGYRAVASKASDYLSALEQLPHPQGVVLWTCLGAHALDMLGQLGDLVLVARATPKDERLPQVQRIGSRLEAAMSVLNGISCKKLRKRGQR